MWLLLTARGPTWSYPKFHYRLVCPWPSLRLSTHDAFAVSTAIAPGQGTQRARLSARDPNHTTSRGRSQVPRPQALQGPGGEARRSRAWVPSGRTICRTTPSCRPPPIPFFEPPRRGVTETGGTPGNTRGVSFGVCAVAPPLALSAMCVRAACFLARLLHAGPCCLWGCSRDAVPRVSACSRVFPRVPLHRVTACVAPPTHSGNPPHTRNASAHVRAHRPGFSRLDLDSSRGPC